MVKLSKRLLAIAEHISSAKKAADIGSDHGLLPQYLIDSGKADFVLASDNKKGPFQKLEKVCQNPSYLGKISASLSDGLSDIDSSFDTIIITGMGGDLIIKILDEGFKKQQYNARFVLSPHGNISQLREFMLQKEYKIEKETIVEEGHFYEIISFVPGKSSLTEEEIFFGPLLLKEKNEIFIKKYQSKLFSLRQLLLNKNLTSERIKEINQEIERITKNDIIKEIDS